MKNRILTLILCFNACALSAQSLPDIVIQDTQVFPESVTSTRDGRVFIGSVKGIVYRAGPADSIAVPFILHSEANGILTILGVLADEQANTLWLCSVPNFFGPERSEGISALMAFDLDTGRFKASYPFPAPASVCNDITIAADGSAYASDTSNGRIFKLAPGAGELAEYAADPLLVGIDGLAFSASDVLYVNNVRSNKLYRVDTQADGSFAGLVELALSHELGGPDGMRLIEGNRFIQAEGTIGRLSVVTIDRDSASLQVLRDDLQSTPGATVVGNTAYVIESHIQYLFNPELKGKDPGDFVIYAVPLQ